MSAIPSTRTPGWEAMVAQALNQTTNGYPYLSLAVEPPAPPQDGYTYFDTALGKVRTYASGAWHNHF